MKAAALREMGESELRRKLAELRREYLDLRIKQASQQLKNPLKLREVRRDIARILTILREKEILKEKK